MADAPRPGLAVALTAFNSMRTIRRVLESVQPVAAKIVVVDSGSTDETPEVCRALGAEVIHHAWEGFGRQKQFAMDQCLDLAWTLVLDSDESLEPALADSIRRVVETDDPAYDGWWLNRKLWFLDGWLHHAFQPEWRLRLVRSDRGSIANPDLHESVVVPGRTGRLDGDLRHDSFDGVGDYAQRIITYSDLAAQRRDKGGRVVNLICNPLVAFFKQLLLKRAFLDGRRGFIVACMDLNTTLMKHCFLAAQRVEDTRDEGE